jgi:hypothetical protein
MGYKRDKKKQSWTEKAERGENERERERARE